MSEINQTNSSKEKPTLVITTGDEAGIGPEIILKALFYKKLTENNNFIIVGNKKNLESTFTSLKSIGIKNIVDPELLNIKDLKVSNFDIKEPSKESGSASFFYLKHAIEIVKQLPNSALVTGPICKKSWSLAGHQYSGQTELLSETFNTQNVGMLFTAKSPYTGWRFNTLLATTHIPIKEISNALSENLINSKLDLLFTFCKKFKKSPSIYVAGLNPHAGEEGVLGLEEVNLIKNTLNNWNIKNPLANISGPLSPDSCWVSSAKAWREEDKTANDGILAMYHDQGLIPVKIITLNYSVNTTIGLPIIRTSPDHGTGFDIAGKGLAQSQSMSEAIKTAIELIN
tara:strand:- start:215 stop:1240 length:1026 start_codon:yes stop_codon:yes gene_type:complete